MVQVASREEILGTCFLSGGPCILFADRMTRVSSEIQIYCVRTFISPLINIVSELSVDDSTPTVT